MVNGGDHDTREQQKTERAGEHGCAERAVVVCLYNDSDEKWIVLLVDSDLLVDERENKDIGGHG